MAQRFKIPFPLYGENRTPPQSDQPAQTVVDLLNVRPYDTSELRLRGGQRPGLKKWGVGTHLSETSEAVAAVNSVSYMNLDIIDYPGPGDSTPAPEVNISLADYGVGTVYGVETVELDNGNFLYAYENISGDFAYKVLNPEGGVVQAEISNTLPNADFSISKALFAGKFIDGKIFLVASAPVLSAVGGIIFAILSADATSVTTFETSIPVSATGAQIFYGGVGMNPTDNIATIFGKRNTTTGFVYFYRIDSDGVGSSPAPIFAYNSGTSGQITGAVTDDLGTIVYVDSTNSSAFHIFITTITDTTTRTTMDSGFSNGARGTGISKLAGSDTNILIHWWGDSTNSAAYGTFFGVWDYTATQIVANTKVLASSDYPTADSIRITSRAAYINGYSVFCSFTDGAGAGDVVGYTTIAADGTITDKFTEIDAEPTARAMNAFTIETNNVLKLTYYDPIPAAEGLYYRDLVFAPAAIPPATRTLAKKLVAISDNTVWIESTSGVMAILTDSIDTVDQSIDIGLQEAFQKDFVINDSTFKVVDFTNTLISTDDLGTNPPTFGMALTGSTSGAIMIVDYASPLTGGFYNVYGAQTTLADFITETVTGINSNGDSVSFDISGGTKPVTPHYYTWDTFLGDDGIYGVLPERATMSTLYRGRVVLSGNPKAPFQWYMSRQSNPYDFAYGATDLQAPVAGGSSDVGELGDVVRALISYKDDYLVFGCASTMWIMRGDPAAGGSLNELSLTTGIFGKDSFCYGDNDILYFLGNDGLYACIPGNTPVTNISENVLPEFPGSWGISPETHNVTMAFDHENKGIIISAVNISDNTNQSYWYDLRTKGFFPEIYPAVTSPHSLFRYDSLDITQSGLLIGSTDGYIRIFSLGTKSDDIGEAKEAINSFVSYGPIPMSNDPDISGRLLSLSITTTDTTDSVTYRAYTDKTAEGLVSNVEDNPETSYKFSGVIFGSVNRPSRIAKRAFGTYLGIWLGNDTAEETWSMEILAGSIEESGMFKENS